MSHSSKWCYENHHQIFLRFWRMWIWNMSIVMCLKHSLSKYLLLFFPSKNNLISWFWCSIFMGSVNMLFHTKIILIFTHIFFVCAFGSNKPLFFHNYFIVLNKLEINDLLTKKSFYNFFSFSWDCIQVTFLKKYPMRQSDYLFFLWI